LGFFQHSPPRQRILLAAPVNDPRAKAELAKYEKEVAEELLLESSRNSDWPVGEVEESLLRQHSTTMEVAPTMTTTTTKKRRGRKKKGEESTVSSSSTTSLRSSHQANSSAVTRRNPMDVLFAQKLLDSGEEVTLGSISQALYRCELARDALLDLCVFPAKKRKKKPLETSSQEEDDDDVEKVYHVELKALAERIQQNFGPLPNLESQRRRRARQNHHSDPVALETRERLMESASFVEAWAEACGYTTTRLKQTIVAGRAARQALVAANMRLVFVLAKRHEGRGVGFSDLVQEGAIGLMSAAAKFDPERGYKFSTYAFHWIRQAMLRSLACQSRLIRLPMYVHDEVVRLHRQKSAFLHDNAREPSENELAEALEVAPAKVKKLLDAAQRAMPVSVDDALSAAQKLSSGASAVQQSSVSFSAGSSGTIKHRGYNPLNEFDDASGSMYFSGTSKRVPRRSPRKRKPQASANGDQALCVGDTLVSLEPNGETTTDLAFLDTAIKNVLETHLDSDERWVIRRRFGLESGQRRSLVQIADEINQPKAWVKAVEASALRKLKNPSARTALRSHNEQKDILFRAISKTGSRPAQFIQQAADPYQGCL